MGGILTIAVADAFSDALGIHISEESENRHTHREIWLSTLSTFLSKFFFALTFVIPILMFEIPKAIFVSVGWGLFMLGIFSYYLSKEQGSNPLKVVSEHLLIAVIVITLGHFIGDWISRVFK
jgi:VIT1/CCC1 family predicted Fe2+/Mn2+ transporter